MNQAARSKPAASKTGGFGGLCGRRRPFFGRFGQAV